MANLTNRTRKASFLEVLGRDVSKAAAAIGVSRSTVYEWRDDLDFARAWDDKIAGNVDAVEDVLFDEALAGNVDAAKTILKARRRELYGDQSKIEHSGAVSLVQLGDIGREAAA